MSSSDGLVLSDALLWQARLRKPEKYGKKPVFGKIKSERPGIHCPFESGQRKIVLAASVTTKIIRKP